MENLQVSLPLDKSFFVKQGNFYKITILDSPCSQMTSWYEAAFVDEQNMAVEGIEIIFSSGGSEKTVVSDSNGIARWDNAPDGTCSMKFGCIEKIREIMYPRWESRTASVCSEQDSDDVETVFIKDPLPSLWIDAQKTKTVILRQYVVNIRLVGMFFDHAKNFLLPSAMSGIRKLKEIYDKNPNAKLLIVGHTNTLAKSGPGYNDRLSLERAESVKSYLIDDVESWMGWYKDKAVWPSRVWDYTEDQYMLSALPDGSDDSEGAAEENRPFWRKTDTKTADAYIRYKKYNGITPENGYVTDDLRKSIIKDYMSIDNTSLPDTAEIVVHGCGQYWIDREPGDDERNRRVEIFVFDGPVSPAPEGTLSGPDATDYPAWRSLVQTSLDFSSDAVETLELQVLNHDDEPVASADVTCTGPSVLTGKTDSEGNLFFPSIIPGEYAIQVSKNGYQVSDATLTVPVDNSDSASFSSSPATTKTSATKGDITRIYVKPYILCMTEAEVEADTDEEKEKKNAVYMYEYEGRNKSGLALVIGGVHGDEHPGKDVTYRLLQLFEMGKRPYFNTILIPELFPNNKFRKCNKPPKVSNGLGVDPNRNFPLTGTDYESTTKDMKDRRIVRENGALMDLIQEKKPSRICTVHSIASNPNNAGIYADPRTEKPANPKTSPQGKALGFAPDETLAKRMVAKIIEGDKKGCPGNKVGKSEEKYYFPLSSPDEDKIYKPAPRESLQPRNSEMTKTDGVSLGEWGSTATDNRSGIAIITVELPGDSGISDLSGAAQTKREIEVVAHADAILEIFLGEPQGTEWNIEPISTFPSVVT